MLKQHRELRAKQLEERKKARDEAVKQMAIAARKLAESKFEENIQSESLYCLRHAITALKNLQDVMQVAANFWRETHRACDEITGNSMVKRLDTLKNMDVEKRKRLWNARGLKMEAVKYYAQWVAIQQMCAFSRDSLTDSQRQVHHFIRQNPSKEQGIELLQILAKELSRLDIQQPKELEDAKKDSD